MTKRGRPFEYDSDIERPVTVSLRIPRDLYNRMETYRRMHRQSITELLLDGLRLRLETPADPRDIILSDDNTVIQEVQEMIRAAVQAEIGKLTAFLNNTPFGPSAPLGETVEELSHNSNTVLQSVDVPQDQTPISATDQQAGEGEDTGAPAYDTSKYALGKLCPRGHDYHGTGHSLRHRRRHVCLDCDAEQARKRRKARAAGGAA